MLAQWIGEVIVQLHMNKISKKDLAEEMEVTPEYISMVLNGHRDPANAEQKVKAALNRLLERKNAERSES